jgi:hypothetical protein
MVLFKRPLHEVLAATKECKSSQAYNLQLNQETLHSLPQTPHVKLGFQGKQHVLSVCQQFQVLIRAEIARQCDQGVCVQHLTPRSLVNSRPTKAGSPQSRLNLPHPWSLAHCCQGSGRPSAPSRQEYLQDSLMACCSKCCLFEQLGSKPLAVRRGQRFMVHSLLSLPGLAYPQGQKMAGLM